ncbi:MAG: ferrous iron transporter B [Burkholderiaceae bacterium]
MQTSPLYFVDSSPLVALIGNPNCGKTAIFNLLTGSRQKVANYSGVTVERKEGKITQDDGRSIRLLDLPGVYSLYPRSLDERVTHDVLKGIAAGEKKPDIAVCVVDATNLRRTLRLALAVQRLGVPCILALNMSDLAKKRGIEIDTQALSIALNMPVISTIGIEPQGVQSLKQFLLNEFNQNTFESFIQSSQKHVPEQSDSQMQDTDKIQTILSQMGLDEVNPDMISERIDHWVLHPLWGSLILGLVLFVVFQSVFVLANEPMQAIKDLSNWTGESLGPHIGIELLRSLVVDGLIAGVGGVLVFLPQILILFFFILILEESGYLPRAAYLLDRLMGNVGLSGRSFIPLLSSFACAIPGIMAARTITNTRDRIVTILISPLMTCSARLPVYTLLITAFIPEKTMALGLSMRGLVLFALYALGIVGAMAVAWVLKSLTRAGHVTRPLMMELPNYHWPTLQNVGIGLWQRAKIFLNRVGGVILVLTIGLWFLASFPTAPVGFEGAPIEASFAGYIGHALSHLFEPIGFNWQISVALIPGMAAREVVVGALGTVYAIASNSANASNELGHVLTQTWSLPTALSLLVWFVFAPQCLSTIATVKRETGSWKLPIVMLLYLFSLAYLASWITYRLSSIYL